eukprot:908386-Pelagomonas_calceolata.AAC.1
MPQLLRPTAHDAWVGVVHGGFSQLPLTLLNSVLGLSQLASATFPSKDTTRCRRAVASIVYILLVLCNMVNRNVPLIVGLWGFLALHHCLHHRLTVSLRIHGSKHSVHYSTKAALFFVCTASQALRLHMHVTRGQARHSRVESKGGGHECGPHQRFCLAGLDACVPWVRGPCSTGKHSQSSCAILGLNVCVPWVKGPCSTGKLRRPTRRGQLSAYCETFFSMQTVRVSYDALCHRAEGLASQASLSVSTRIR